MSKVDVPFDQEFTEHVEREVFSGIDDELEEAFADLDWALYGSDDS